jgi:mycothiol synthase
MQTTNPTAEAAPAADAVPRLVLRPYAGEADLPELVRIQNADVASEGIRERVSLAELAAYYRHPSDAFDATRDVLVAEVDGSPVGFVQVEWVDTTDGLREYRSGGHVDPAWRRRGIGTRLLRGAWRLIAERAAEHPTELPQLVGMWADDKQAGRLALAGAHGYEPARWFFVMERSVAEPLPDVPPLPDGLQLRAARSEDAAAIWATDHEAFRDHWGGHDDSEANFRRWFESPEFQPENFLVAWDGDEIAGAVLNVIYHEENAELGIRRGWLDSVYTRRPWRGRGLARALIMRSLRLLAARGMDTAALGVDADNPSGALRLYESCGFTVSERATAYRRPLEGIR